MSFSKKKEAINKLTFAVADNLGIENQPNIEYYQSDKIGDFGGYFAETNTIYINEYNIDDAKETADTIAHELRHCWQHEYAEKADTPLAREFRENFENYVRPEDDYSEYKQQAVERDAQEFSEGIIDIINHFNVDEIVTKSPSMVETINVSSYSNLNHKKETIFNSEPTKNVLSYNTNLKFIETIEDQYFDLVNNTIKDIRLDENLTNEEKNIYIKDILHDCGFNSVDENVVEAFLDKNITVIKFDQNNLLYRRGDDEGTISRPFYGRWWSEDKMSIEETRNNLAVLEEWGKTLKDVYVANPPKNTIALKGIAAPQIGDSGEYRQGGATQFYIEKTDSSWCHKEVSE